MDHVGDGDFAHFLPNSEKERPEGDYGISHTSSSITQLSIGILALQTFRVRVIFNLSIEPFETGNLIDHPQRRAKNIIFPYIDKCTPTTQNFKSLGNIWEKPTTVDPILSHLERADAVARFHLTTVHDFMVVYLHWLDLAADKAGPLSIHSRMDGVHLLQNTGLDEHPTHDKQSLLGGVCLKNRVKRRRSRALMGGGEDQRVHNKIPGTLSGKENITQNTVIETNNLDEGSAKRKRARCLPGGLKGKLAHNRVTRGGTRKTPRGQLDDDLAMSTNRIFIFQFEELRRSATGGALTVR
ncbi:reverse transcriptase [Trichonephila clavipes]|nr:reverse transcriptase [Trichonephila clavipes]